jgi:hypothetical protein
MKNIFTAFGIVIFTTAVFSAHAQIRKNLIYSNDFESVGTALKWNSLEEADQNGLQQSDSIAHSGKYSLRVLVNKTDKTVSNGKRAEVTLKGDSSATVERWVGYSIFLPNSYTIDPQPESVQQWHDIPDLADGGVWRSPPFALLTQNGHWVVLVRWSAARLTSNETSFSKYIDLGNYDNNVWTNWVFHIRFSYNNDGLIEIWKNGVLIKTINGPNTYNDKVGNYFKLGIYKWVWLPKYHSNSTTTQREVFYDDVRIGNENATYSDVAP